MVQDAGIDDTPPWVNPSIVDQLYTSGKIKKPVAGFYLARYGEGESEMILGDVTARYASRGAQLCNANTA